MARPRSPRQLWPPAEGLGGGFSELLQALQQEVALLKTENAALRRGGSGEGASLVSEPSPGRSSFDQAPMDCSDASSFRVVKVGDKRDSGAVLEPTCVDPKKARPSPFQSDPVLEDMVAQALRSADQACRQVADMETRAHEG